MSLLISLRTSLLLAFKSLPLLLIGFIGFLAFGLGNTALAILLVGHALVVPALTEFFHLLRGSSSSLIRSNDVSQLVASNTPTAVNVYPSYWMAHISFFFSYLFTNALSIYVQRPDISVIQRASSDAAKVSINQKIAARQEKAITLMISVSVLFVIITILRVIATGSETLMGLIIAVFILGGAGAGWYIAAEGLGATNADIYGVIVQMMTPEAGARNPKTCIYTGRPT